MLQGGACFDTLMMFVFDFCLATTTCCLQARGSVSHQQDCLTRHNLDTVPLSATDRSGALDRWPQLGGQYGGSTSATRGVIRRGH